MYEKHMSESKAHNGLAMTITGGLMLIASVLYLFLSDDPFPMWLIIGGAGVMFIGTGAAVQNQHPKGTSR